MTATWSVQGGIGRGLGLLTVQPRLFPDITRPPSGRALPQLLYPEILLSVTLAPADRVRSCAIVVTPYSG